MSTFLGSPNPAFSYFEALERVEYIIIRKSPRTWRIDREVNRLYDDPGAYEYRTLYSDIYTEGREYEIQASEHDWNYAYQQWLSILSSRNRQKSWMHRLIPMLATPKENNRSSGTASRS